MREPGCFPARCGVARKPTPALCATARVCFSTSCFAALEYYCLPRFCSPALLCLVRCYSWTQPCLARPSVNLLRLLCLASHALSRLLRYCSRALLCPQCRRSRGLLSLPCCCPLALRSSCTATNRRASALLSAARGRLAAPCVDSEGVSPSLALLLVDWTLLSKPSLVNVPPLPCRCSQRLPFRQRRHSCVSARALSCPPWRFSRVFPRFVPCCSWVLLSCWLCFSRLLL